MLFIDLKVVSVVERFLHHRLVDTLCAHLVAVFNTLDGMHLGTESHHSHDRFAVHLVFEVAEFAAILVTEERVIGRQVGAIEPVVLDGEHLLLNIAVCNVEK